jgi:hypothetical protein
MAFSDSMKHIRIKRSPGIVRSIRAFAKEALGSFAVRRRFRNALAGRTTGRFPSSYGPGVNLIDAVDAHFANKIAPEIEKSIAVLSDRLDGIIREGIPEAGDPSHQEQSIYNIHLSNLNPLLKAEVAAGLAETISLAENWGVADLVGKYADLRLLQARVELEILSRARMNLFDQQVAKARGSAPF